MTETNDWCRLAGLNRPVLADITPSAEKNVYRRLIAVLLERGAPMTLEAVAARFDDVGWAPKDKALRSLKRCKPARAPVYRDGDLYAIDPHDDEMWLVGSFLGLQSPRVAPAPEPAPLPDDSVPLTPEELDEAWRDESLHSLSSRRVALAVLDADGYPQPPGAVVAAASRRARFHRLAADEPQICRSNSPIMQTLDGQWALRPTAEPHLRKVRAIVREQIAKRRRYAGPTDEEIAENRQRHERARWAASRRMSRLRRCVLRALPPGRPLGIALKDLSSGEVEVAFPDDYPSLVERLKGFDLIAGEQIRATLRALGFEWGERRLADMSPPQKTMKIGRRTVKIDTVKLIRDSCDITRAFGDEKATRRRLKAGERAGLTRLAKDVEHLAIYEEYSRLHGAVSVRDGNWMYVLRAKWVHRHEPGLRALMKTAVEAGGLLEIVRVSAARSDEAWAGAELVTVLQVDRFEWVLLDASEREVEPLTIQRARLASGGRVI